MRKVHFFIVFSLILTLFTGLNAEESVMFVAAPSGINVRSEPNVKSRSLGLLNFGEKNGVLAYGPEEVIDNIKSRWIKIRSEKGEGWVFGGFLRNYDVNTLKTFSAAYFRKYFSEKYESEIKMRNEFMKGDRFISLKEFDEKYAPHIRLTKMEEKDVKIVSSFEKLFLIETPSFMVYMPGVVRRKSLWLYGNNGWTLINEFVSTLNIMYDGTEYPGLVIRSSETTYATVSLFLYDGSAYRKNQEFVTAGQSECVFPDKNGKFYINFVKYYDKDVSGKYYFNGKIFLKTSDVK